MRYVAS